jgi:hypothetical protein
LSDQNSFRARLIDGMVVQGGPGTIRATSGRRILIGWPPGISRAVPLTITAEGHTVQVLIEPGGNG